MHRIAVIIPHYEDQTRLARCLEALTAQDGPDVDIVVVDNASPSGLGTLPARFPAARFVTQPEKGAAAARNKGVEVSTAPALAFLDADCLPAPDWLDQVRALAAQPPRIWGGRMTVFDESPPPRSGAEAFETVFAFDQENYILNKGFSVTANLVTTRAIFDETGPFVPGLSEDLDWCRRATARGAHLEYAPALSVAHPTRADWSALARKWRRLTDEAYATARAGGTGRLAWTARALLMPVSALVHAPRVLRHPGLGRGDRARALVTLIRLRVTRMFWMLRQAFRGSV